MLKLLDLFGVDFPFRVANYQSFKSKTGGIFFLIYLFCMIAYFVYGIYDYFENGKYETIYYQESFLENEVNLVNQEFTIGVNDNYGLIRKNELKMESLYEDFENLEYFPMEERKCKKEEFNTMSNTTIKNEDLICFNNTLEDIISVDQDKPKILTYRIFPGKNKLNVTKKINIGIIYPINLYNGFKTEKVLGSINTPIEPKYKKIIYFKIEKSIYINDDGLLFGNNSTKIILNVEDFKIIYKTREREDEEFLYVDLMQSYKVHGKFTRRKRLYTVILEMISMATTLLANFKAIVGILNLKKAKQKVFEDIYHINAFKKEEIRIPQRIEIKEISPCQNQSKDVSGIGQISQSARNNENKENKNRNSSIRDLNENSLISIQNNKNNNDNNDNENEEKIIKEKMFEINNNYPTVSGKTNYRKDPRFVRSFFSVIFLQMQCKNKRLKDINKMNEIIENEFGKYMNINNFFKRQKKLEVVEDILFDPTEEVLLDYIALPLLNLSKKRKEKVAMNNFDFDELEMVFKEYNDIIKKPKKSEIERKLVEFLREKVENN